MQGFLELLYSSAQEFVRRRWLLPRNHVVPDVQSDLSIQS